MKKKYNYIEKWYWISLSYATFAIMTIDDVVMNGAPISTWMKRKHIDFIKQWVKKKRGVIKEI